VDYDTTNQFRPPAREPDIFEQCPWQGRDLAIGLGIAAVWWLMFFLPSFSWAKTHVALWFAVMWTIQICVYALYPAWILHRRRLGVPNRPGLSRLAKEGGLALLAAIFASTAVGVFTLILGRFLPSFVDPATPWDSVARSVDLLQIIGIAVVGVMLAPMAEEIFFRGFLFNALRQRRLPTVLAACVQSAVFAGVHHYGAYATVGVFFYGIVLSGIYSWRRTLLTPVLTHGAINFVGILGLIAVAIQSAHAPVLGVHCSAHSGGLLVDEVLAGTGAEREGIRPGDILVAYDGTALSDFQQLIRLSHSGSIGQRVRLTILRQGKRLEKNVTLGPRPPS
jgi:membrane protease YdiL (CAAX protease family)